MEIKQRLLSILNSLIQSNGTDGGKNELLYYCPFCNHHKQKLQVNVITQQWHCWVCDAKGKSIFSLAKKLKAPKSVFTELSQIFKNSKKYTFDSAEKSKIVKLPDEFFTLRGKNESLSFKHAKAYLEKRNITQEDIIRYNIGYCTDGTYGGRIIIPSYDENGILNYFIARSFYNSYLKYKNPPVPKDTVIFELYINWKMPIVLCEGVFDAIAIKRNAIPLLGKTVQDKLLKKMINNNVPEVIVALDSDAQSTMINVCDKLIRHGLNVSRTSLKEGDPSSLGFNGMLSELAERSYVTDYDLILQKINI